MSRGSIEVLETSLNPMTKEECEAELGAWLDALKAVAEKVRDAELKVIGAEDGGEDVGEVANVAATGTELRAERDVVCVMSNCPQLNNPCNGYNPTPVRLLIW